jgi:TonB family protein
MSSCDDREVLVRHPREFVEMGTGPVVSLASVVRSGVRPRGLAASSVRVKLPLGAALLGAVVAGLVLCWAPTPALASPTLVPPRRTDATPVPYPADGHGDASVALTLVVDAQGVVTDVQVTRGEPPFAEAAAAAVRAWRFEPATRDEVPIPARISATVDFRAPPPAQRAPAAALAQAAPPVPAPASAAGPPAVPRGETVSVRGEREELDAIHIPRTEVRFVPGAFGDPFRVVEALPGVAPWLSGLPYYYVRTSPPENVGYTIDGIRVPLLFHVGSGPSTIAPALVDSVDLYPGAYPARYGRYAGAIIAGETTPPKTDRTRAEFGARVFDANAFAETPYDGGRGSVMAASRYGYTDLVIALVAPKYTVRYWDYQGRVSHRAWGDDTVSVFAFGAYDQLTYLGERTFRVEYHRADLRYDHPIDGGSVRVAATVGSDDTFTALQTSTGAGASAALRGPSGRLRAELDERVGPMARVRAGADLGVARFDVDDYNGVVHGAHTDFEAGVYADAVWRPLHAVELVPGFRLDAYRARGRTALAPQPRLAAKMRVSPEVSWVSAFGVAHQEPTEEVFVPAKLPDAVDEAPRDSFQASQAVEVRLPSSMRARVTGFASRLVAPSVAGEQRAEGVELFLQRDFTERLGGFVSYTLSRSDTALRAATYESLWDRTHLLSVVLGYDLGGGWRAAARFFFESGRSYMVTCPTPSCAPASGPPVYSVTRRLPPFFRLDGRIERRWTFSGGQWLAVTFECFNALDKAEPIGGDYSPATGLTIRTQSPIILPSFGLEGGL